MGMVRRRLMDRRVEIDAAEPCRIELASVHTLASFSEATCIRAYSLAAPHTLMDAMQVL